MGFSLVRLVAVKIAIVLAALLVLRSAESEAAVVSLRKVWSLETQTGSAVVVQNHLGGGDLPVFPLKALLLRDCRRPKSGKGPDEQLHAVLEVSPSGIPQNELIYVPAQLVSHGSFGDESIISLVVSPSTPTTLGRKILQAAGAEPTQVRGLEKSPRSDAGVLLQRYSTHFLRLDSGEARLTIPHHVYEVAYARDRDILAVLTLHRDAGEVDFTGDERSQIVVFNYEGKILVESLPSSPGHPYQQLYLDPAGQWLTVTQRGYDYSTIATDFVTLLDVNTGDTVRLADVSGGLRYHSLDGRSMVLVQTGWGRVHCYDMSNPKQPHKLWSWEQAPLVASAAVNWDGSLVALIAGTGAEGRDAGETVVVLNRQGSVVAQEVKSRQATFGIMFAGDYLIVGLQAALVPAYVWQQATHTVDMYYVRRLP